MSAPQSVLALVPPILVKRDFLSVADHRDLLLASLAAEAEYTPSLVSRYEEGPPSAGLIDESSRRSTKRRLDHRFRDLFIDKVLALKSDIASSIRVDFPAVPDFEFEAVNSGDGSFFSTHIDTVRGTLAHHRAISAVYYYGRSPKRFSGGELKIYSLDRSRSLVVEPVDNSIVFFPSIFPHEVLPVAVPAGTFEDGRFSVNCWIYRQN
jgi:Rps23 Pro-64 3,4-dihydroxylase Tpa1-like proline 4-hydroxylase